VVMRSRITGIPPENRLRFVRVQQSLKSNDAKPVVTRRTTCRYATHSKDGLRSNASEAISFACANVQES